jgi:hypothetical protein
VQSDVGKYEGGARYARLFTRVVYGCQAAATIAAPIETTSSGLRSHLTELRIIYLQRKEFGLLPEGADQSGPAAHAAQSKASVSANLPEILRTEVGQLVLLPCAHRYSTGFNSGAYAGRNSNQRRPRCSRTKSHTARLRWLGSPSQTISYLPGI